MKRPNKWLSLIVWLLPASKVKNTLLRAIGNTIGRDVVLGPNLVLGCGPFRIGDRAVVSPFNIFRQMASVELEKDNFIGRLNQFTAAPSYQRFSDRAGVLSMAEQSAITNRHYFDCSGRIDMEAYSAVGGTRSLLQSHEIDIVEDRTTIGTITIGERSLTATACLILKNARVPAFSLVAAGSVVTASSNAAAGDAGIYAGAPAKWRRELPECKWWYRSSYMTPVREVEGF
ncbi:acyltransferase [Gordonia terrae]|uniref:acyltransferase n=1 Tax=Gordonia terrae TaxID=2055 RepID=UPI003F6AA35B